METQLEKTDRKPLPAHILKQVEQCGAAGRLAQEHRERREDKNGTREVRTEIVRAWMVEDQAQLPDAFAAQQWLWSFAAGKTGTVRSVGKTLGLIDSETGEELASGRADAIIDMADGEVLVVQWVVGEHPFMLEPEEDPGLVAMGLAASNGKPYRVAHVFLRDGEAICRRSSVYDPAQHAEQLERIRKLATTPRDVACPGSWCTRCRVAPHCPSWLARAKTALVAMTTDVVVDDEGKIEVAEGFELTDENAGAFAEKLEFVGKLYDYGKAMRDGYARRGGKVRLNGKILMMSPRDGRVTASGKTIKNIATDLRKALEKGEAVDLKLLAEALEGAVNVGDPYDVPTFMKPKAMGARK